MTGIFLIITVVAYVVGTSFYVGTTLGGLLGLVGIFAFIGFWVFLIKTIISRQTLDCVTMFGGFGANSVLRQK